MWLNHAAIATPGNGTNSHTVTPNTTAIAGTGFTPTAGNLLVLVVEGAVTSTTPTGWTLGGSAINNTGLYVWYRVAAGNDSITTTHNGSNYPVVFDWYEFPAGTTWAGAANNNNVTSGSAGPTLSGLTGSTNFVAYSAATISTSTADNYSYTWSKGTEAVDTCAPRTTAGTDGYMYSTAYQDNYAAATASAAATISGSYLANQERLVWAVKQPATATQWTLSGTISAISGVSGTASVTSGNKATTGNLSLSSSLSGVAQKNGYAQAVLDWYPTLVGNSSKVVTASGIVAGTSATVGSIKAKFRASGTVVGSSGATGTSAAKMPVDGLTIGVTGVVGNATAKHWLTGVVVCSDSVSGNIEVLSPSDLSLSATVTATCAVSGTIFSNLHTVGAVNSVTNVTGTPVALHSFAGLVIGQEDSNGSITARLPVSGLITPTTSVNGDVHLLASILGTNQLDSHIFGSVKSIVNLSGIVSPISNVIGDMVKLGTGPIFYVQVNGQLVVPSMNIVINGVEYPVRAYIVQNGQEIQITV
jgi:hypothetical protein